MSRTQARTRKGGKRVPSPHTPRPVSKYFRFDWNFAFQIARAPYIKWVSRIVFSTPLIAPFLPVLQLDRPQVRLLWLASTGYCTDCNAHGLSPKSSCNRVKFAR
jgi:hypothetical protein